MHDPTGSPTAGSADGSNSPNIVTPAIHQRPSSLSEIVSNAIVADPGASSNRQPFFSGLTKALTGKQEAGTIVRQEAVPSEPVIPAVAEPSPMPMPLPSKIFKLRETPAVIPVEPMPVPPPEPTPLLPPEPTPLPPVKGANLREPQPIRQARFEAVPMPGTESKAIIPIVPMGEATLGRPRETKGTVEIIQSAPTPGPRETRGVVTVETLPTLPALPVLPQQR
jgi:hypothetical protein